MSPTSPSIRILTSVAQISALCATLGILSGCVVEEHPHHRRGPMVEEAPPPPPPSDASVSVAVEDTPPPPSEFVVVEHDAPPPPSRGIAVRIAPPPLRHEVIPPAPSRNHVWLPGHWRYVHGSYQWYAGRYELRPRPGARYIAPHWEHRAEGHVFIEGYWKL